MKHRKEAAPHPLRADVINVPASPRATPTPSGLAMFAAVRNAGRILCAFCGGLVIGRYLMGLDVTVPALGGAALGLNELLYHLAETLAAGRHRAISAHTPTLVDSFHVRPAQSFARGRW